MVGFLMLWGSSLFTIKSLLDTWRARFLKRWLNLTQVSCLRTFNSILENNVVPLLREKVMKTQNVTLSNTQEGKIQKRNEFLIQD